ncbi:DEAD/DEAH box helicase domain protein [Segniliparus rotundus DSM 44985]|uniref:RNA helicase n=1 Tax=Segniliparus rotundus (strain ATCC BAA-972 / CDC 1076 / CIP 108378 / DSM 44985 / JCM 13578) TaxID=640132 RepID=D6ZAF8_SEGRD|nr:DEAD/DEAH box helicase [Segniliparus rotundus]ADG96700.1 DEAD/DEAH box helicase domain protein [Segniliparus rotundus DSM 44985]
MITTDIGPSFAELGVHPEIVASLAAAGKHNAFAIQEQALPLALGGHDLIGQARTGMGKTLAFGIPLLQRVAEAAAEDIPRALVVVPTRELCLQVTNDLVDACKQLKLSDGRPTRIVSLYGGRPYEGQIATLEKGVDVVVGTPGRLLDLWGRGNLKLNAIRMLVLDEADEMLDLGFLPDVEKIMAKLPTGKQTMLFSATIPGPVLTLARTFMTQPTHIRAESHDTAAVHERTTQHVYRAHALNKDELVSRFLQAEGRGTTMIFTRTKRSAGKLADELVERGFSAGSLHGDMSQGAREEALSGFRKGKIEILVCTDVAARGIDIDGITHVINYTCPEDEKVYVHRIGRTGRAGRTGIAITLVDWEDLPRWEHINTALGLNHAEPPETYSNSPHIYTDLGIPEGSTGRLTPAQPAPPRAERRERGERPGRRGDSPKPVRDRQRVRRNSATGAAPASGAPATAAAEVGAAPSGAGDADGGAKRPRRRRRRGGAAQPAAE